MDGYLLVNKPNGISSFGVVAKVRGVWRAQLRSVDLSPKKAKVGHTGTLDPAAEGLMILVLGAFTKRAGEFSKMDKLYEVEATLGAISSTGDTEGRITKKTQVAPSLEEVQAVLEILTGQIMQLPPIYSAIKVGGKRAYQLAREGKEVVLQPREVNIHSISNIEYKYPKLCFIAHVGSGTYIRSLVEDIGTKLGTGAYMSHLRRTKVGDNTLEQAISIGDLDYQLLLKSLQK